MRSVSATFLAAQQATSAEPYIRLYFTSYDGGTNVDLSMDSETYGNRILYIDHWIGAYDGYASIVLVDNDHTIPDLRGYWIEPGYGYVTGAGNEYLGDGTNEGAPPRLWVKHQQYISVGGQELVLLELEGMWAKLRETLIRLGDHIPWYDYPFTDETIYNILYIILGEAGFTLNALAEDDGLIDELIPEFDINAQPFEYAASLIYRLIYMTKSWLKSLDDLEFEVKYPSADDTIAVTFYTTTAPEYLDYRERQNIIVPNHIIVFGNEGSDGLWTEILSSDDSEYGLVQESIDLYGDVYQIVLAGSLNTQAMVDARADAIAYRKRYEESAGTVEVLAEFRLELFDRIDIVNTRIS